MLFLILAAAVSATYVRLHDPQGRRDPFVSQQPRAQRGSLVQELKLTGIARTPEGYRALVEGAIGQSQFSPWATGSTTGRSSPSMLTA